ncbi:hypothetical protein NXS19_012653 [Fusarium pseudograminearum]|nr:hypothetical protein NXS19_012653 [Fusarium pseudograminearum]
MLFAMFFVFFRVLQIITLIPCMGMLAWFVDGFVKQNALTPDSILILFIVSVLALAWAIFTLFSYHRSSTNAHFVAFVDALFFGAFIAAVYYLRYVQNTDCVSIRRSDDWDVSAGNVRVIGPSYDLVNNKPCSMLKACWAFGHHEHHLLCHHLSRRFLARWTYERLRPHPLFSPILPLQPSQPPKPLPLWLSSQQP